MCQYVELFFYMMFLVLKVSVHCSLDEDVQSQILANEK